jgi:type IV pilus assembly protein PilZ
MSKPNILSLAIKDKNALYAAYMPYVTNGGLFIPTKKKFTLGEDVFMLLTLMNSKERIPISGKVVWLTAVGTQGAKAAGIGVQFAQLDKGSTRNKIEVHLAGALDAEHPTHTM